MNPQSKTCLICSSGDLYEHQAWASDSKERVFVNIVECDACAFAWQFPLSRTVEESIEWFDCAYHDAGKTQSSYFDPDQKRKIALLELEFVSGVPTRGRRILDIGGGAGVFAEVAAENGWVVTVVDPALEVCRVQANANIRAIKGTVEDIPPNELFDIVTMWDVIEHVENPVELLHYANRHVRESGWLVIETGNYKSADRVSGGNEHWIYQLDHRWYFSPDSIKRLLTEAGYSEFVFVEKVLRPDWSSNIDYEGPSRLRLLGNIIRHPISLKKYLSMYRGLCKAKCWEMSGLAIFAVAARRVG